MDWGGVVGGGGQELPALVSRGQPQRGLMWGWRRGAWVNPLPLQPRLPSLRPPSTLQVSFQHEAYPAEPGPVTPGKELEEQPLSRQVFVVQELEVRDRLASSQINKFLYLHTSERMPRRTHSNMVQATPVGPPQAGHPRMPVCTCAYTHTGTDTPAPGVCVSLEDVGGARAGLAEGTTWTGLILCLQLKIKALHVAPVTNLGGPECCLRVSLLPLRLNVDQVSGPIEGRARGYPAAWGPLTSRAPAPAGCPALPQGLLHQPGCQHQPHGPGGG